MLGRRASVVNFGRDGYGLLQMMDLAAVKVPELRPDLVLVTFISDDLSRARFWRTVATVDGEERVLTTTEPERNPSIDRAADTAMIDSRATEGWCRAELGGGDGGATTRLVLDKKRRLMSHAGRDGLRRSSLWTVRHSFVWNRIVHGSAVHFATRRPTASQNPRLGMVDYAADPRFVAAVETVRRKAGKLVLIHRLLASIGGSCQVILDD
jgi:hypothetical protein